jgi:predicted aldo/keto reductase-like oxidoreductase
MKPLAGGALDDAELALRFITSNPNVTVVIPGMAEEKEIEQNIRAVNDTSALTQQELEKIQQYRDTLGTQFCRRCNYCQPCSAGISICSMFILAGYYNRYNLPDWATARYMSMGKTASDCIGCGVCETRCPYNLPIRQMMKKVEKLFGK